MLKTDLHAWMVKLPAFKSRPTKQTIGMVHHPSRTGTQRSTETNVMDPVFEYVSCNAAFDSSKSTLVAHYENDGICVFV